MKKNGVILTKIASLVPGYTGYTNPSERKNCDKKFRNYIFNMLSFVDDQLHARVNTSISIKDSVQMNDLNSIRNKIGELKLKIDIEPYVHSTLVSDYLINEGDLNTICELDLELTEHIDELTHTVSEERSASLHQMILEIDNIFEKRTLFVKRF